jgi:hypothetical protein
LPVEAPDGGIVAPSRQQVDGGADMPHGGESGDEFGVQGRQPILQHLRGVRRGAHLVGRKVQTQPGVVRGGVLSPFQCVGSSHSVGAQVHVRIRACESHQLGQRGPLSSVSPIHLSLRSRSLVEPIDDAVEAGGRRRAGGHHGRTASCGSGCMTVSSSFTPARASPV